MEYRELDLNGKVVRVFFEEIEGKVWIHSAGDTWVSEVKERERKSRRGTQIQQPGGPVVAPMPGKIVAVKVASGEEVKAHQVVIIMEAMKMEYTLKASGDGRVTEIRVQPGDQVVVDQELVTFEPLEEDPS